MPVRLCPHFERRRSVSPEVRALLPSCLTLSPEPFSCSRLESRHPSTAIRVVARIGASERLHEREFPTGHRALSVSSASNHSCTSQSVATGLHHGRDRQPRHHGGDRHCRADRENGREGSDRSDREHAAARPERESRRIGRCSHSQSPFRRSPARRFAGLSRRSVMKPVARPQPLRLRMDHAPGDTGVHY